MSRVVIVGSGVAGSFLAHALLDRGASEVVMLEAGTDIPMADRAWWLHFVATGQTPYQANYDAASDFVAQGHNPWNIEGGRIFGRGGTTLHWGGWVPRFKPEDFKLYTNTGRGIDWPFDYDELEAYYLDAERWLGASGDSHSQDPPRSGPYPLEPAPYPLTAERFIRAFDELGYGCGHLPVARFGRSLDGSGACVTTGTCDYCPVAGRFNGNQPVDRLAQRTGFRLQLGAAVTRIRMASRAVAAGVTYTDVATGKSVDLDADSVFLCAGAFETPKLLLASRCPEWPQGIGNDHDLVGRFLVANAFFFAEGVADNPQRLTQELGFPSLASRQFDTEKEQATAKLFLTMNYSAPYLNLAQGMAKGQPRAALEGAAVGPAQFQLYGNVSPLGQPENRVGLAEGSTRFGLPKTLVDTPAPARDERAFQKWMGLAENVVKTMGCSKVSSGTYPQRGDHAACTTRMALTPDQGVVDPRHRVFGTENLIVLSNSVLPTLPAANPTLTTVALGFRLIDQYGAGLTA